MKISFQSAKAKSQQQNVFLKTTIKSTVLCLPMVEVVHSNSLESEHISYLTTMIRVIPLLSKHASVLRQSRRRFSGLGNPMFPERARPELQELDKAAAAAASDGTNKKYNEKGSPDFLSNHGGKVAIVAFGLAIYLFYGYWRGGQNRTKVEDDVLKFANIEPYELQEMRYLNNLNPQQFNEVADKCRSHFASNDNFATYSEFIAFLKTVRCLSRWKFENSYVLDRFVQSYVTQTLDAQYHKERAEDMTGVIDLSMRKLKYFPQGEGLFSNKISYKDVPISVDLLLVVLNLCMVEDASQRVGSLFHLASLHDVDSDEVEASSEAASEGEAAPESSEAVVTISNGMGVL